MGNRERFTDAQVHDIAARAGACTKTVWKYLAGGVIRGNVAQRIARVVAQDTEAKASAATAATT
ncbi:hypothetical protein EON77_14455 [bacterium]|nr:MAG: hypothetical protein EON77_14455 [bacterium]